MALDQRIKEPETDERETFQTPYTNTQILGYHKLKVDRRRRRRRQSVEALLIPSLASLHGAVPILLTLETANPGPPPPNTLPLDLRCEGNKSTIPDADASAPACKSLTIPVKFVSSGEDRDVFGFDIDGGSARLMIAVTRTI
ncbi:hypothetical protein BU17DRAFT_100062 [Hysterangium stoloniferum]|nr:hypothetical protein BU17DRAFT_100062 [Hysterangium stoloniferum]